MWLNWNREKETEKRRRMKEYIWSSLVDSLINNSILARIFALSPIMFQLNAKRRLVVPVVSERWAARHWWKLGFPWKRRLRFQPTIVVTRVARHRATSSATLRCHASSSICDYLRRVTYRQRGGSWICREFRNCAQCTQYATGGVIALQFIVATASVARADCLTTDGLFPLVTLNFLHCRSRF